MGRSDCRPNWKNKSHGRGEGNIERLAVLQHQGFGLWSNRCRLAQDYVPVPNVFLVRARRFGRFTWRHRSKSEMMIWNHSVKDIQILSSDVLKHYFPRTDQLWYTKNRTPCRNTRDDTELKKPGLGAGFWAWSILAWTPVLQFPCGFQLSIHSNGGAGMVYSVKKQG